MDLNPRPGVRLDIGELVLDGFPSAHADRVAESFQRELTRLVTEHGIPSEAATATELQAHLPELRAGGPPPHRLGEALARAVHAALTEGEGRPAR
ncbi:hypothetical protein E1265_34785 [Streptomyces sp. 8K308]|uniref:hypothetical protein n=1 Tax=Streptomyces sp. 8K308 TaxID=2530388 RepID=UPI001046E973|nr:hypothetical protein [Streptomyces sp. 8K308]TDC06406.1 hypothetical protein E1265_34785 [Streptomyces sp. 8K308]